MSAPRRARLPNGVALDYVERGDAAGPALILVHAIADSRRIFEPLMDALPGSIRTVALSQRGHGDSDRPPDGYHPADHAADLVAFVQALGIDRAVIAGASSGGIASRRFAIDHPDRTAGLVLLGSPFTLAGNPEVEKMWESTFAGLSDPIDPALVRGFVAATVGDAVPRDRVEIVVEENLKAPAAVWKATMRGLIDDDSHTRLGRIAAPTLIVWGDRDPILPRTDQEALARSIPGAELVVREGAGHTLYLEDPARVAADIARFVLAH